MSDADRAVLRFAASRLQADDAPLAAAARHGSAPTAVSNDTCLIVDPAWTPQPGDEAAGLLALRVVAGRALAREDLFPTTTTLLDGWAEAAGVVAAMTVDGTSFWYRRRLWAWRWLQERLIWIEILDEIARGRLFGAIEEPAADEQALRDVALLMARRDGLVWVARPEREAGAGPRREGRPVPDDPDPRPSASLRGVVDDRDALGSGHPLTRFLRDLVRRSMLRPADRKRARIAARRAAADRRIDALAADGGGRLIAIVDPAVRQAVETPRGRQSIDPFLGPVLDRLAGTPLDPIVVELGSRAADDETWDRLSGARGERLISGDTLERRCGDPGDEAESIQRARDVELALEACRAPLVHSGVDLGPDLRAALSRFARDALAARLREVARARRLLGVLRPAAILMVDEYGRTEWSSAARQLGIPVAAVQHGIIHPWHPGYQHRLRPDVRPVPSRTYCFGDFERRLLLAIGGYRPDEIVIAGSPRLDLVAADGSAVDRDHVRTELDCGPGDRLLVISTTFASVYRRFFTPVALGALLGEPLAGVRIVIKLHPGEADGELYRRLLAGLAGSGGGAANELAIVKDVDLYRLLSAADAHLGLYSTVLTEAVVTGTPNLLAATQASSDLLGYVAAGVAIPVRTAADLRAALETPTVPDPVARQAFLDDHFRPGRAADRIAADLLSWLAG